MMNKIILTSLIVIGLTACSSRDLKRSTPTEAEQKPAEVGLSKTALTDTTQPAQYIYPDGDRPKIKRWSHVSPPMIPHGVADYIPITKTENQCVDCHDNKETGPTATPALPVSHKTDFRKKTPPGDKMVPARYVCTACHVPQSNALPLVKNEF